MSNCSHERGPVAHIPAESCDRPATHVHETPEADDLYCEKHSCRACTPLTVVAARDSVSQ